jgi:hypothetical protein
MPALRRRQTMAYRFLARPAMTLLHWNMLTVSISCFLLIGGFSLRQRRGIPVALMLLGIVGLLGVLTYNVHHLAG